MRAKKRYNNGKNKIRIEVIAAIFILIAVFYLVLSKGSFKKQEIKSEEDIKAFIIEDAKSKFTNASYFEIINMIKEDEKNYEITVKVDYYYLKDGNFCVRREHVRYAYPRRGFANLPPEKIFEGCSPYEKDKINFKEEAMLVSFPSIKDFVLNEKAYPEVVGKDGGKNWTVVWKANTGEKRAVVNDKGEVVEIK